MYIKIGSGDEVCNINVFESLAKHSGMHYSSERYPFYSFFHKIKTTNDKLIIGGCSIEKTEDVKNILLAINEKIMDLSKKVIGKDQLKEITLG